MNPGVAVDVNFELVVLLKAEQAVVYDTGRVIAVPSHSFAVHPLHCQVVRVENHASATAVSDEVDLVVQNDQV